ncbi:MAG: tRNA (adenosine(37)-N6)-threonylcarbamoyltransferase complex ATPase subunit type 1 TsaE [Acholeplasmatales bacterium]|jgi:tRNA threonylcarbamoyladenosine biosynthesis protein TsaE|nr:tRNA (adenosine(37)-N6)-threonylcarbamoyltransferase complex ATPase subunit type 1 TsaE [Acholeplasmatales bacterium]
MLISNSALETILIGETLGKKIKGTKTNILLYGDLGSGKTQIVKGIAKGLGIHDIVNSPTFTVMKKYVGDDILYHLDLYRLNSVGQDFDLEEFIDSEGICAIEWPDNIEEILPDKYIKIEITILSDETRMIDITSVGE